MNGEETVTLIPSHNRSRPTKPSKMAVVQCGRRSFNFGLVTVEPALFLYMLATFLTYPTFQAFLYEKVCLHQHNQSTCNNLRNKTFEEAHRAEADHVQSETSYWILKKNIAEMVPSCLVVLLFLGSWGDKVGRKLPVLLPCFGAGLSSLSLLAMSLYPSSRLEYVYIAAALNGVSGAFVAFLMSVYSYVAHITDTGSRTTRMGVLEATTFLAAFVGVFISGVMLENTSFVFVFSFISVAHFLALGYAVVRLDDIKADVARQEGQGCCDFWMVASIKASCRCVMRSRGDRKTLYLCLLLIVFVIAALGTAAEIDLLFLYTRRTPLIWSPTMFGYYKGLENLTRSVALLTILPLFKKKFKFKDTTVGIFGLLSKALGLIVIGLAKETWHMFIVVILAVLQGFPGAAVRSRLSCLVDQSEQGRLFGVVGAFEGISSLLATVMFNEIYPSSLTFFPGFSFLFAASLCILATGILIWLHRDNQAVDRCKGVVENKTDSDAGNVNQVYSQFPETLQD